MTSKQLTSPLPISSSRDASTTLTEKAVTAAFTLIQWPWLLRSLYGGSRADKRSLLRRLDLPANALPHLGSWKADTFLLHRLVDLVEETRPLSVVELGSGASSLVVAKALQRVHPPGHLFSYDQNEDFVRSVGSWLADHDIAAATTLRHAPLTQRSRKWPGLWYHLHNLPSQIDLLIIDGPPWSVHPLGRGAADLLFPRLANGGAVVLDDAARPGERIIARRWRRDWPEIAFSLERGGNKGMLIGRKV